MKVSFIGDIQTGKTTTFALLHLKSVEMELEHQLQYRPRTRLAGHDLYLLGDRLRRGEPLPPTPPEGKVLPSIMSFACPYGPLGIKKKRFDVSTVDVSGELINNLFRTLPDVGWDIAALEKKLDEWGLREEDMNEINNHILNCDVFVVVIDGYQAVKPEGRQTSQDVALTHFLENVGTYKERNLKSPRIKGMGVILTKTDRLQSLPNMSRDPTESQIQDFMRVSLFQTAGYLQRLSDDLKFKTRFFYHWLIPTGSAKDDRPVRFEIDPNKIMIRYPDNQYAALIKWMRDIS